MTPVGRGPPSLPRGKTTKYKTYNEGHVPDIIRPNGSDSGRHELFEVKVPSSLTKTAMSNGHYFAFGNTEEALVKRVLGLRHAADGHDPLRRARLGRGRRAHHGRHPLAQSHAQGAPPPDALYPCLIGCGRTR